MNGLITSALAGHRQPDLIRIDADTDLRFPDLQALEDIEARRLDPQFAPKPVGETGREGPFEIGSAASPWQEYEGEKLRQPD